MIPEDAGSTGVGNVVARGDSPLELVRSDALPARDISRAGVDGGVKPRPPPTPCVSDFREFRIATRR